MKIAPVALNRAKTLVSALLRDKDTVSEASCGISRIASHSTYLDFIEKQRFFR